MPNHDAPELASALRSPRYWISAGRLSRNFARWEQNGRYSFVSARFAAQASPGGAPEPVRTSDVLRAKARSHDRQPIHFQSS